MSDCKLCYAAKYNSEKRTNVDVLVTILNVTCDNQSGEVTID